MPNVVQGLQVQMALTCPQLEQLANPVLQVGPAIMTWGIIDPNGAGVGALKPSCIVAPSTVYELAAAIRRAEVVRGVTARAFGTLDSFCDAAFPLPQSSTLDEPAGNFSIDTHLLRGSLQCFLPTILRVTASAANLFFVEAGIKLADLNVLLDLQVPSRALPTMGGSSTQSLAGAVSTGTHGMDFDRPPLADCVRAIYLIGAGGVHHWIEGTEPLTNATALTTMFPCLDPANIHYDDQMLHDAIVSFGSMGVFYAMLIQTVPQYDLTQYTTYSTWEYLTAPVSSNGGGPDLANALNGIFTGANSAGHVGTKVRALQVLVNPIKNHDDLYPDGSHDCYVTNRVEGVFLNGPPPSPLGNANGLSLDSLVSAIQGDYKHVHWFDFDLLDNFQDFISAEQNKGLYGPNVLFTEVLDFVAFCEAQGYSWAVRDAIDSLLESAYPEVVNDDPNYPPYTNTGYKVMASSAFSTTFPYKLLASTEAFFDLPTAISYVTDLLGFFDSQVDQAEYPAGYISLRVCGPTEATLGPQQAAPTGCVETALLATDGAPYMIRTVEEMAGTAGGVLHWGQSNGFMFAPNVARFYGSAAINSWKATQQALGGKTFTNWFMTRFGLT